MLRKRSDGDRASQIGSSSKAAANLIYGELIMKTLFNLLNNLLKDESGQDLIEYALVAGLIGVGAIVAMTGLGTKIGTSFTSVGTSLTNAV
jgi:pilus assembly protein Flp/PilA